MLPLQQPFHYIANNQILLSTNISLIASFISMNMQHVIYKHEYATITYVYIVHNVCFIKLFEELCLLPYVHFIWLLQLDICLV